MLLRPKVFDDLLVLGWQALHVLPMNVQVPLTQQLRVVHELAKSLFATGDALIGICLQCVGHRADAALSHF